MLHFRISDKNYSFDLNFKGKFNYLIGKNGSHKTHFIKVLQKLKRRVRSVKGYVSVDDKDLVMSAIHLYMNDDSTDVDVLLETMLKCRNHIFVIDECNPVMFSERIGGILIDSQNYFIMLGHTVDGYLPVNVESVFMLKVLHKVITNVSMYQRFDIKEIGEVDYILTEDSKSSRLFFEYYFPNIRICSKTGMLEGKVLSRDNSQLHNFLKEDIMEYDNILLVYDASAYAAFLPLLYGVLADIKVLNENLVKKGKIPKKVKIIDWDSFESYVLSLPVFNISITQDDTKCLYNSIEQMCEQLLSKMINYKKDVLPICIHPNKTCINCKRVCNYRNSLDKQLCIQRPLDTITENIVKSEKEREFDTKTIKKEKYKFDSMDAF